MQLPPFTDPSRAAVLPAWLQRPLLQPAHWPARVRLHALFLGLIGASSLFVHPYLGIGLTPKQLTVHSLLVVASAAVCLGLAEALATAWARARADEGSVTTGGFLLRAAAGYLGSALFVGFSHRPWAYTRAIMESHEAGGRASIVLSMAPLALLVTCLAYQFARKEALLRELAALKRLNDRLRLEPGADEGGAGASPPAGAAITVPSNGVDLALPASSIARVRADENYCHVVTRASPERPARSHLVRMTLAEALDLLPARHFVQTHRSHIVNLACVAEVRRDGSRQELVMRDGDRVPVSRARMAKVRERLADFLSGDLA